MAFLQIWALGQGAHARPMAAKRAPAQDVPSVSAVRRPLIVSNYLTRSAVPAGFRRGPHTRPGRESRRLSRSLRVRAAQDGCEFHRPKRGAALWRQIEEAPWRKPDAQRRRWRNSSAFLRAHSQTNACRRNAGSRSFGSDPSCTMSLFANRGLGPHSRIAGLLLFPLRPSRGNCLSATTGFRFQWRRNRFACRNLLFWRFSGRPNWRSG